MKPRDASSKSRVSENGNALRIAACCATTDAEASLGAPLDACLDAAPRLVWVMLPSFANSGNQGFAPRALPNREMRRSTVI
jgi:hypothetical protein